MRKIIKNDHHLKEHDITDFVKKVKVLLINSHNEVMLAHCHNQYQFPGGTQEPEEDLIDTLNREIKEETGLQLNIKVLDPIIGSFGYYKDWPEIGRNKKIEIYYYEILTDEKPKLDHTHLTENEKAGNFALRYISFNKIEEEILKNVEQYGDVQGIAKEMLEILKLYKENND